MSRRIVKESQYFEYYCQLNARSLRDCACAVLGVRGSQNLV